jgi:hypothetical protein
MSRLRGHLVSEKKPPELALLPQLELFFVMTCISFLFQYLAHYYQCLSCHAELCLMEEFEV